MPGLLILPYGGVEPSFGGAPVHAGAGAAVLGRVTLGSRAWLGARAVVRGDGHYVEIGDDFRLGAGGTVHIAHDLYPTHIGAGVTAGRNSVIHACDVGDGCWIGRDVVILDGSRIGPGAALADGSLVFPRSELEGGWLYEGQPARPVRRLEAGELEALHARARAEATSIRTRLERRRTGARRSSWPRRPRSLVRSSSARAPASGTGAGSRPVTARSWWGPGRTCRTTRCCIAPGEACGSAARRPSATTSG
jgi:carbonic anhydrase/acetyltransferase-like protein (isoleucine patch superfamily)